VSTWRLPDGFLLGTATAATQVEGGERNHDWAAFCERIPSPIVDKTTCLRACDHWNRVEEDVALQKALGCRVHRLGFEWSRLEPEEGRFDENAVEHYRKELALLRAAGILPMVTLFHFSLPLWLSAQGGFESERGILAFVRYAEFCARRFGDLVESWATVNEPNVYATVGYLGGIWPPGGKHPLRVALKVMRNLCLAHVDAYRKIHEVLGPAAKVGFAQHLRVFDPATKAPWDRLAARLLDRVFQSASTEALCTGRLRFPLGCGAPRGRGDFCDFLGINYYTRDLVRLSLKSLYAVVPHPTAPKSDLGWELYPEGLERLSRTYHARYRKPLWITENGICDAKDVMRTEYLESHLASCAKLCAEGLPVERYYHWTLMDNFEWAEGESARFGLIETDFETQRRTIRSSGRWFASVARDLAPPHADAPVL
jgi:beta-glucosidase